MAATSGFSPCMSAISSMHSMVISVESMSITASRMSASLRAGPLLSTSNIKAGQTINLLISQPGVGTGSLSYDSTFKFTPGNQYTASAFESAQDIITFITFDNSSIYASAIKNLV